MIKILLIVPAATGTIGRCSYNLYRALSQRKDVVIRVVLLYKSPEDVFDFGATYHLSGIQNSFWGRLFKIFRSIFFLRKIKREWCPDVTIGTLNVCSAYNVLSGGREKKIGIFHGEFAWKTMEHKSIAALIWGKFCYRFLFSRLNWRVGVSVRVKKLTEGYVCSLKGKSCVIYNAHDIDSIVSLAKHPLSADDAAIFDNDVILAVGAIVENKGVCRLVKAFSSVKKESPNLKLVFLGHDLGEKEKALRLVKYFNLTEDVFFIGHRSNPYPYIKKAKLLVSASYSEGLPGVLCEAGVLNIPVITTNSSAGVWEILDCLENYDENLTGIYWAKKGGIVQNLSSTKIVQESEELTDDERVLSEAITKYLLDTRLYEQTKATENPFIDEIRFEEVSRRFLDLAGKKSEG